MRIEYRHDPDLTETTLTVAGNDREEGERLVRLLVNTFSESVNGYTGESVRRLRQADLIRVYAEGSRVLCQTAEGVFSLHARLWEMEECLDSSLFVRISKGEIINKHKIVRLDVTLGGTVGVELDGGIRTYTSRRYVTAIKRALGV